MDLWQLLCSQNKKVFMSRFFQMVMWFCLLMDDTFLIICLKEITVCSSKKKSLRYTTVCIYSEWHCFTTIISNFVFLGSGQKKTVYIDSPLLKTEMTVRERNHIYHEESLKLSIKKNGSKHVFHLMTELPANEQQLSLVCRHTNWSFSVCHLTHQNSYSLFFLCFLIRRALKEI